MSFAFVMPCSIASDYSLFISDGRGLGAVGIAVGNANSSAGSPLPWSAVSCAQGLGKAVDRSATVHRPAMTVTLPTKGR